MNDPTATRADIEIFPSFDRLYFIALMITRVKTFGIWPISARANPRFFIAWLMGNFLFDMFRLYHSFYLPNLITFVNTALMSDE